ncbi:SH3 domain-containing protein [Peribacillus sp. SCS-26]|uniref:SH3 domain-containing protein n=1 Tax=Paraperibacillus marinus TaxID=3115295 RepID=UPI00390688DC
MKKLSVCLLSFVLFFTVFSFSPAKGATLYSGTLTANVTLFESAWSKSKKVGTMSKGSIVTVYSKNKYGWSEVQGKSGKRVYVRTAYLKLSSKISFLKDKTKTYVFKNPNGTTSTVAFVKTVKGLPNVNYKQQGIKPTTLNQWKITNKSSAYYEYEHETAEGLFFQNRDRYNNINDTTRIGYPLYIGNTWVLNPMDEEPGNAKITSIGKTIKTPAGNFKNVIEVTQYPYDYSMGMPPEIVYYAKNVGELKRTFKGKTISELIQIKKR